MSRKLDRCCLRSFFARYLLHSVESFFSSMHISSNPSPLKSYMYRQHSCTHHASLQFIKITYTHVTLVLWSSWLGVTNSVHNVKIFTTEILNNCLEENFGNADLNVVVNKLQSFTTVFDGHSDLVATHLNAVCEIMGTNHTTDSYSENCDIQHWV